MATPMAPEIRHLNSPSLVYQSMVPVCSATLMLQEMLLTSPLARVLMSPAFLKNWYGIQLAMSVNRSNRMPKADNTVGRMSQMVPQASATKSSFRKYSKK